MSDNVNHPSHYNQGGVECIDAIKGATVNKSPFEAICVANVIKYLWRYEEKGGLEDVMKRIYDKEPDECAPLLVDGSNHLLLLHAHDDTEAMVPEYYKIFIEELLKNGVEFIKPGFIS